MKQILKKVSSICAALFCAAAITVSGTGAVWAAEAEEDVLKQQMTMVAEGLTDTIIPLADEEIEQYAQSDDAFTVSAMTAWSGAKAELGEKEEADEGETEISYTNGEYTVTVPRAFTKYDAEFVYVFDKEGVPTSVVVNVVYPMSVTLQRAGLNTLMGIGTVFVMLVFLSFIIYLFKFVPGLVDRKKKEEAKPAAPAPVAAAPVAAVEETDDTELIAVIAAAIAASEGTSPDGFVVRSIRKVNRRKR